MARRPIGGFAKADLESMRLANQLQILSMEYIKEVFSAVEPLNIDNLTYERFMRELDRAQTGGPEAMDEFNRQLVAILKPVVDQVMAPPQQQGQPPQSAQQPPQGGNP